MGQSLAAGAYAVPFVLLFVNLTASRVVCLGCAALQGNLYLAFANDRNEKSLSTERFGWQGVGASCRVFVGDGEHVVASQVDVLVDERCVVVKV
jgi:hypothetical protein